MSAWSLWGSALVLLGTLACIAAIAYLIPLALHGRVVVPIP